MPEGTALLQKSLIKRKKWTTRQNVSQVVSSHQLTIRGFFFRELLSHMKNNMTAIKVFWSMEVNFLLVWEPAIFFFNYQFRTFLFGTLKHCARKGIVKIVCRALANTTFQ